MRCCWSIRNNKFDAGRFRDDEGNRFEGALEFESDDAWENITHDSDVVLSFKRITKREFFPSKLSAESKKFLSGHFSLLAELVGLNMDSSDVVTRYQDYSVLHQTLYRVHRRLIRCEECCVFLYAWLDLIWPYPKFFCRLVLTDPIHFLAV